MELHKRIIKITQREQRPCGPRLSRLWLSLASKVSSATAPRLFRTAALNHGALRPAPVAAIDRCACLLRAVTSPRCCFLSFFFCSLARPFSFALLLSPMAGAPCDPTPHIRLCPISAERSSHASLSFPTTGLLSKEHTDWLAAPSACPMVSPLGKVPGPGERSAADGTTAAGGSPAARGKGEARERAQKAIFRCRFLSCPVYRH